MPWKTVVEIGKHLSELGLKVTILNICSTGQVVHLKDANVEMTTISRSSKAIYNYLKKSQFNIIYWPTTWWKFWFDIMCVRGIQGKLVCYFPGERYRFIDIIRVVPQLKLDSLKYLLQSMYPSKLLKIKLELMKCQSCITMTNKTKQEVEKTGIKSVKLQAIPPGLDRVNQLKYKTTVDDNITTSLSDDEFLLFMGPPSNIRGIDILLKAFIKLNKEIDIKLLCLFRNDKNVDCVKILKKLKQKYKNPNIIFVDESVTNSERLFFMQRARALVIPFLIVPSEIPMLAIEAGETTTPVLTTGPNGTSEYACVAGNFAKFGSVNSLKNLMLSFLSDKSVEQKAKRHASTIYDEHPNWSKVAVSWYSMGNTAP